VKNFKLQQLLTVLVSFLPCSSTSVLKIAESQEKLCTESFHSSI